MAASLARFLLFSPPAGALHCGTFGHTKGKTMSVSGIGSTSSIAATLELLSTRASQADSTDGTGDTEAVATEVSGPARWMRELDSLASSDPEKFKSVTASIAAKLKEMASGASGDQAKLLGDMATHFEQASQTGSIDALKPKGGPPPGPPPGDAAGKVQKYADQQGSDTEATKQALLDALEAFIRSAIQDGGGTKGQTSSATAQTSATSGASGEAARRSLFASVDQLIEQQLGSANG